MARSRYRFRGKGMRIKSIQRGVVSFAGTSDLSVAVTITSVVTGLSRAYYLGSYASSTASSSAAYSMCRVSLTNATTVTITRGVATAGAGTVSCGYEIIEWEVAPAGKAMRLKSLQRGSIIHSSITTTATITSVDTTKAIIEWLGVEAAAAGTAQVTTAKPRVELTNATTVSAIAVATQSDVVGYEVEEWEEVAVA